MPRPLSTGEFREACSLWVDEVGHGAGLSAEQVSGIFNHEPDGRPRNNLSPYRFVTDGSWGLVHAIGDEAMAILKRLADAAAAGTDRLPARLAAPRWEDRNVGVVLDGQETHYWAPEIIVCRNAEQHVRWQRSSRDEKAAHVQDLVSRGLARQLRLLGLAVDLPVVKVTDIKRERAVPKLRAKPANAFVRVATVAFVLPASLHGHWAAGALINRGFGSIVPLHETSSYGSAAHG